MKKKKRAVTQKRKDDQPLTLRDLLSEDLKKELTEQKQQLKAKEERKKEEEEQRKREERRLKEKNKSFEELLQESSLDWKNFK